MTRKWRLVFFVTFFSSWVLLSLTLWMHAWNINSKTGRKLFSGWVLEYSMTPKKTKLENYSSLALASPDQRKKFFQYMSEKGGPFLFFPSSASFLCAFGFLWPKGPSKKVRGRRRQNRSVFFQVGVRNKHAASASRVFWRRGRDKNFP